MLRVQVSEGGEPALPPIDVGDASFAIGSAPGARVRLPASVARPEHVRIDASGPGGARAATWRTADASGTVGGGCDIAIGRFHVRISPSPAGSNATPPHRTESLARELMRALLGANAAPSLEVERGPHLGAKRTLAPPESSLVIGRGDAASWVIADGDLSKAHAEIRRGWDGVRVFDLASKNGTRVDGERVGDGGAELADGALVELGRLALRYRDPAEAHLGGPAPRAARRDRRPRKPAAFYAALVIAGAALAGLVGLAVGGLL